LFSLRYRCGNIGETGMHGELRAGQCMEAAETVSTGSDQGPAIRKYGQPGHGAAVGRYRADKGPFRQGEESTGPGIIARSEDTAVSGEGKGSDLSGKVR
jgi:hypothetical protein